MRMQALKTAQLGSLSAHGTTKAAAAAALDKQIQWMAQHGETVQIESMLGALGVLTATAEGWSYTIVLPADISAGAHKRHYGSCTFGECAYTEALSTMRNAMAQRTWTPAVDDESHIAAARVLPNHASDLRTLFGHYRANQLAS